MRFVADLHLHSRFARATSRALNPENLYKWGALKGLTVVGTGDFTHPGWIAELKEHLAPAEAGLYRLKDEFRTPVEADLYPSCRGEVRFLLSTEISVIYKKDGSTRKVHHMVLMPDFDAVERLNARLSEIGNLASDGGRFWGWTAGTWWRSAWRRVRMCSLSRRTSGRPTLRFLGSIRGSTAWRPALRICCPIFSRWRRGCLPIRR